MIYAMKMRLVSGVQRVVAKVSFRVHARRNPGSRPISWVVGPDEIASMVTSIAAAIPRSYSTCLVKHPFYLGPYDYEGASASRGLLVQMCREAWKFGALVADAEGFIYLGSTGFLRAQADSREFELSFLKQRGLGICCFFTGNDIRSIRVMAEQEEQFGLPNIATYLPALNPVFASDAYDSARKEIARTANEHADVIFNARVDQAGYLTRETEPFLYFYPQDMICDPRERFSVLQKPVVLHAPSSPVIKGTQLVRAAVAALQAEGFEFEYIELIGVPHEEVKLQLQRAHIVLNEFYSYMPGVFGIEAMASGAVLLTSADQRIETDLPDGSNEAWVVTHHHEVTTRLREVLQAGPERLLAQAIAGQRWVREHATAAVSGSVLREVLERSRKR